MSLHAPTIRTPQPRSPQRLDARSRSLQALIARRLREHPELLRVGHNNLVRWAQREGGWGRSTPYLHRWDEAILHGVDTVIALLTDPSEESQPLRQAHPFAGVLSDPEVRLFLTEWENAH